MSKVNDGPEIRHRAVVAQSPPVTLYVKVTVLPLVTVGALALNVAITGTVTGVAVPVIATFSASAPTVTNGNTVTFTYNVTGGDCATTARCRISGPSFTFDIPNGLNDGNPHVSSAATPPAGATSLYTLTVVNSTGTPA